MFCCVEGEGRGEKRIRKGKRKRKGKENSFFMRIWMEKGRERREME